MKKICIISNRFEPDLGGSEVLAREIINYFHKKKYIVELITTSSKEFRDLSKYSYEIYGLDNTNIHLYNNIISENNYDACLFISDLQSYFLNQYSFGCKNNFCILNLDERIYEIKQKFQNSTNNLKNFNKVFSFTKNGVCNKFLEENNINYQYVENFSRDVLETNIEKTDKEKIKNIFQNDSKIILYPAAFEERKSQLNVIKMMNGSSPLREYNWIFIGAVNDENYLKHCMSFSKEKNINAKFIKGTNNLTLVDKLYQSVDLVCLLSIAEGMPLILLEALSADLPWVSSDVGGVRGVLGHTNTGIIVNKNNFTENEIYSCIKNSLDKRKLFYNRQVWKDNFTPERCINKYEQYMKENIL